MNTIPDDLGVMGRVQQDSSGQHVHGGVQGSQQGPVKLKNVLDKDVEGLEAFLDSITSSLVSSERRYSSFLSLLVY